MAQASRASASRGQRLAGDFEHGLLEPTRVVGDPRSLGVVDPVHRQQVGADDGAAMRVRAGQHDPVAGQPVSFLEGRSDPVRQVAIDADQIQRDQQDGPSAGSLIARALAQRSWTAPSDGFVREA